MVEKCFGDVRVRNFISFLESVKDLNFKVGYGDAYDAVSRNPKYGKIIARLFNSGEVNFSNIEYLINLLDVAQRRGLKTDFNRFKTLKDIEEFVHGEQRLDVNVVAAGRNFVVYRPTSVGALMQLGQGSRWCTRDDDNCAIHYFNLNKINGMYVVYKNGKPYLQMSGMSKMGYPYDQAEGVKDRDDHDYIPQEEDRELFLLMQNTAGLDDYLLYLKNYFDKDKVIEDVFSSYKKPKRKKKDLRNLFYNKFRKFSILPKDVIKAAWAYVRGTYFSGTNALIEKLDNDIYEIMYKIDSFSLDLENNKVYHWDYVKVYDLINDKGERDYVSNAGLRDTASVKNILKRVKKELKQEYFELVKYVNEVAKIRGDAKVKSDVI